MTFINLEESKDALGEVQFCLAEKCKTDKDGFLKVKVSIPMCRFKNSSGHEIVYSNLIQGWVKGRWVINRKCLKNDKNDNFSRKYYTITNKNNGLCITINISESSRVNKKIAFNIVNRIYEWENLPENVKFPGIAYYDLLNKLAEFLSDENSKHIQSTIAA